ncbi:MAG: BatD family protein [Alphaproteobacteria bacterium]
MQSSIRLKFLISTLFLFFAMSLGAETLSVHLSPQKVMEGKPVYLRIVYESDTPQVLEEPDLSVLEKDFKLIGRQQAFSSRKINDNYQLAVSLTYELLPTHTGEIIIPSFQIGDVLTDPQKLLVGEKYFSKNVKKNQTKKIEQSNRVFFYAGQILFLLGGFFFLIAGVLILRKKILWRK